MAQRMDKLISQYLLQNWQRKCVAIVSAFFIWLFVNNSITETKTITNVPIRIVNLPADKTIVGLLPNRLLSKRITLTLSGSKDIIQQLEPGDLEVSVDASLASGDEWVVQLSKKNLVSLNPDIDLIHHITQVSHSDIVIKLSKLKTAKIPIRILPPIGEAPSGYEYLDTWPQKLIQTISGPEEEVEKLEAKGGLELIFNLSDITKADLDALKISQASFHDDEINFFVPEKWKWVRIPFHNNTEEEINDPEALNLRIDFLRKGYLSLKKDIPIRIFYPLKYSESINENTHPLAIVNPIAQRNDIAVLSMPLLVRDVSHLFLDIISDNIEIDIVAAPKNEREILAWSLEVIDPHELEDTYVAILLASMNSKNGQSRSHKRKEAALRKRFREYLQRLTLYNNPDQKLILESVLGSDSIKVTIPKNNK